MQGVKKGRKGAEAQRDKGMQDVKIGRKGAKG